MTDTIPERIPPPLLRTLRPLRAAALLTAVLLAWLPQSRAAAADWDFVQAQLENDLLFPTQVSESGDRYYTSGFRAVWLRDPAAERPRWVEWFTRGWCEEHDGCAGRYAPSIGFAVGQQVFTPDELSIAEPQPDDRPWAGFVFASMMLQLESERRQHVFAAQLGLVGRYAGAEQVQRAVHAVVGDEPPAGWDNQLPSEPTLNFSYLSSWRLPLDRQIGELDADIVPHAGAAFGTAMTYLNAGATLRVGRWLHGFPVRTLESSTINRSPFRLRSRSSFYFFAGVDARAVAHNLFLDGTVFHASPSVDSETLVYDLTAGFVYQFADGRQLSIIGVRRSAEFVTPAGEPGTHGFFSVSALFPFE